MLNRLQLHREDGAAHGGAAAFLLVEGRCQVEQGGAGEAQQTQGFVVEGVLPYFVGLWRLVPEGVAHFDYLERLVLDVVTDGGYFLCIGLYGRGVLLVQVLASLRSVIVETCRNTVWILMVIGLRMRLCCSERRCRAKVPGAGAAGRRRGGGAACAARPTA